MHWLRRAGEIEPGHEVRMSWLGDGIIQVDIWDPRGAPVTNENAYTALIGVLEEFVGRAIAPDPISWSEVVE